MVGEEEYRDALRSAVHDALRPYGAGAATVAESAPAGVWTIDVTPAVPGAARAYVAYPGDDEVTFGFGETHVYLWDDDPAVLAGEVGLMLAAVCAGTFVEAGRRGDAHARLRLPDGSRRRVGAIGLPIPWRLRRVRTYRPYGGGAA